ncbi:MAG TPA: hypothetical protein VGC57_03260 [Cellulomonas sp.]
MRHGVRAVLPAGLLVTLLVAPTAGCAVGEAHRSTGEVAAAVQSAGEQAGSAVATVRLSVELLGDGGLSLTATDTAQSDQLEVLEAAERTLTTMSPPDAATGAARDATLTAVQQATRAVVAAGGWITASGGRSTTERDAVPHDVVADLDAAQDALDEAITQAAEAGTAPDAADATAGAS